MNTAPRPGMNSAPTSQAQRPAMSRQGSIGTNNNAPASGWHRFGGPAGQSTPANSSQPRTFGNRPSESVTRGGNSTWNSAPRPGNTSRNEQVAPAPRATNSGGGWQKFTPMPPRSVSGEPVSRGSQNESWRNSGATVNRGAQNESWRNASPRSSVPETRNYGRSSDNNSRPPLNMRQPIVTPRESGRPAYGGAPYGGNRGSYSAPAPRSYSPPPSYSAPSPSRGGYSAPSPGRGGYSAPSPSRGGYSAPSPSRGGYSAPRGGGYSAPSRGGSSGGSSRSSGGSNNGHHGR
jgi:hypothetical protein